MPLLGEGIAAAITALAAMFAAYWTKKVALGAALLTVSVALGVTLYVALSTVLSGLSYVMPSIPHSDVAFYLIDSSGALAFLSAAAATEIAVSTYLFQLRMAQKLAAVS